MEAANVHSSESHFSSPPPRRTGHRPSLPLPPPRMRRTANNHNAVASSSRTRDPPPPPSSQRRKDVLTLDRSDDDDTPRRAPPVTKSAAGRKRPRISSPMEIATVFDAATSGRGRGAPATGSPTPKEARAGRAIGKAVRRVESDVDDLDSLHSGSDTDVHEVMPPRKAKGKGKETAKGQAVPAPSRKAVVGRTASTGSSAALGHRKSSAFRAVHERLDSGGGCRAAYDDDDDDNDDIAPRTPPAKSRSKAAAKSKPTTTRRASSSPDPIDSIGAEGSSSSTADSVTPVKATLPGVKPARVLSPRPMNGEQKVGGKEKEKDKGKGKGKATATAKAPVKAHPMFESMILPEPPPLDDDTPKATKVKKPLPSFKKNVKPSVLDLRDLRSQQQAKDATVTRVSERRRRDEHERGFDDENSQELSQPQSLGSVNSGKRVSTAGNDFFAKRDPWQVKADAYDAVVEKKMEEDNLVMQQEANAKMQEYREAAAAANKASAQANSFFSALGSQEDKKVKRARRREEDERDAKLKAAVSYHGVHDEEGEEEETYRSPGKKSSGEFGNKSDPCPYCAQPMPRDPSTELVDLRRRLQGSASASGSGAATSRSGGAGWTSHSAPLDWQKTITFCAMHRAETSVIPLGLHAGYPPSLDFDDLDRRLEGAFVRSRLRRVVLKPHLSKFFRRAAREIESMGIAAWRDLSNQSSDKVLSVSYPGYYGELGRTIIINHFMSLVKWGHLLSLQAAVVEPLSVSDFVVTVLVPEVSVLLIMEDNGWDGGENPSACRGAEWDAQRQAAMGVRADSAQYGLWRFREDTKDGAATLRRLEQGMGEKKQRLQALSEAAEHAVATKVKSKPKSKPRRAVQGDADEPIVITSASTSAANSDIEALSDADFGAGDVVMSLGDTDTDTGTDAPDPSDYGDGDGDDGDDWMRNALAVADAVEDGRGGSGRSGGGLALQGRGLGQGSAGRGVRTSASTAVSGSGSGSAAAMVGRKSQKLAPAPSVDSLVWEDDAFVKEACATVDVLGGGRPRV